MENNKKTFTITICLTAFLTIIVVLGVLYGLQLLPKGAQFSFDTLGVFLGAFGSVGAIFAIWLTTRKQLNEQKEMQKQNVQISIEQNSLQKQTLIISEEQKEIQKQSVKLVLLDRRMEIYSKVREFIATTIAIFGLYNGQETKYKDQIIEFSYSVREAELFFDRDIYEFIETLLENARLLDKLAQRESEIKDNGPEMQEALQSIVDKHQWFYEQRFKAIEVFDKYINVNNLGL